VCELFIALIPTGGVISSTVGGNNSSFIATPDADLMLVLAVTMLSEGVAPKASCPSMIDSKLAFFFNLLHHRRVAGMLQFSKLSLMHTPQGEVQHFDCRVWLHFT
jgi:hypothetical protein